jgi:hypothetical protein
VPIIYETLPSTEPEVWRVACRRRCLHDGGRVGRHVLSTGRVVLGLARHGPGAWTAVESNATVAGTAQAAAFCGYKKSSLTCYYKLSLNFQVYSARENYLY